MYKHYNNIHEKAQYYSRLGWHTFPVHSINEQGGCTCYRKDCSDPGKHPRTKHGYKDATIDDVKLQSFFYGKDKIAGIALATGTISGVWNLDIDNKGDGADANLKRLEEQYGQLPNTWCYRSGGGGYQFQFSMPIDGQGIPCSECKVSEAIDVRGDGGYSILPPSAHQSGGQYEWIHSPDSTSLKAAPDWLVKLAREGKNTPQEAVKNDSIDVGAGQPKENNGTFTIEASSMDNVERVRLYADNVPPAIVGDGAKNSCWRLGKDLSKAIDGLTIDDAMDGLKDWLDQCEGPLTENDLRYQLKRAIETVDIEDVATSVDQQKTSNVKHVSVPLPQEEADWPVMHEAAFHGFVGEFVRYIEPHTEADPVALLVTTLVQFGNTINRHAHFTVNGDRHYGNIFAAIVGKSSRARKGTSLGCVRALFDGIDTGEVFSGLSTGEGVILHLADVEDESGVFTIPDKRAMVIEAEFARLLGAMSRTENTLSSIIRDSWDHGTLRVMTRKDPLRASGCHISILTHITQEELEAKLSAIDSSNGFGNRFQWILSRRSKLLPNAGELPSLDKFRERLEKIIERASTIGAMSRTDEAQVLWEKIYPTLCEERSGLWDANTSRAEAQVLRLSMLYALLDGSSVIDVPHLHAALAVWQYADDSARIIFGEHDPLESAIIDIVKADPGITLTDLKKVLPRREWHRVDAKIRGLEMRYRLTRKVNLEGRHHITRFWVCDDQQLVTGNSLLDELPVTRCKPNGEPDELPVTRCKPNVKASTLVDLFDWKNSHGAEVIKRDDGCCWLTNSDQLTPSLEKAIMANQDVLRGLLPPDPIPVNDPYDVQVHPDDLPFLQELQAM